MRVSKFNLIKKKKSDCGSLNLNIFIIYYSSISKQNILACRPKANFWQLKTQLALQIENNFKYYTLMKEILVPNGAVENIANPSNLESAFIQLGNFHGDTQRGMHCREGSLCRQEKP